jgi:hypothetical protein
MQTKFWLENLMERDHSGNPDVDGDDIKMDLREIGWEGTDWIRMVQDRAQWRVVVNTVMNLQVPVKAGNLTSLVTISLSGRTLRYALT